MALQSGTYAVKTERTVIVWPGPDKNGDGGEVWEEQYDNQGRNVGRIRAKDRNGEEIFNYTAPEGFRNHPGYDHVDNWILYTERGQIYRQPNGEAVNLKPGQAVVMEPDGSVTYLEDEYAQHVFTKVHEGIAAKENVDAAVKEEKAVSPDKPHEKTYEELLAYVAKLEYELNDNPKE